MRSTLAWFVWVVALIGTIFLALDKLSIVPLVKGTDVGFDSGPLADNPAGICLKADAGYLECKVRLRLTDARGTDISPTLIECQLAGSKDKLDWFPDRQEKDWLLVQKKDGGFLQFGRADPLEIRCSDPKLAKIHLADWEVIPKEKLTPHDSQTRRDRRRWWFWLSFFFLCVATTYTFIGLPTIAKPVTRHEVDRVLVEYLIGQVSGTGAETALMQEMLRAALFRNITNPITAVNWKPSRIHTRDRQQKLWLRAQDLYRQGRQAYKTSL